jgi:hypothetical protein
LKVKIKLNSVFDSRSLFTHLFTVYLQAPKKIAAWLLKRQLPSNPDDRGTTRKTITLLTREIVLYWSAWPRVVQGVDLLAKYLTGPSEQSRVVASPSQFFSQVVL